MLSLKVLATGSKGNCYLLSTDDETLILDCGVKVSDIKKGLNFNISRIAGVVCSHEHKDHNLSLEHLRNMGLKIFAPYEFGDVNSAHVNMGEFDVTSFKVPHNGIHNSGFLIKVKDQKLLYLTDLEYCPYTFKKQTINHVLIECNYQNELVDRYAPNYQHKLKGHCSLETCKSFLEKGLGDGVESVILIHMGEESCNRSECLDVVETVAPSAHIDCAVKGLEVVLKD